MKVAVTGASGFLGRHVMAHLMNHSLKVVAVTRNADHLSDWIDRVDIIEMDIARPHPDCFTALGCPDALIHLAWDGLPNYRSLHHFETELPGQYSFLKRMIEAGLPSLLVAGTCFEYGMQSGPLSEDLPANPQNPYGCAKDTLRRQLQFLQKVRPFSLTWARLFYMFGEGQPKSSLYPLLKEAIARGDKTFKMSGGEQMRDYLPVGEVARLIVLLTLYKDDPGVINVCTGQPVSVRKLVEQWLEEKGWNIELDLGHYPYPDYEPMAFWGNRDRLDRFLDNIGDKE
ncbi:MAG: epimerase [Syntrophus sp. (in: bacteria)]|nr:epimerase [Syntrophus sp. (in: bacteria)]